MLRERLTSCTTRVERFCCGIRTVVHELDSWADSFWNTLKRTPCPTECPGPWNSRGELRRAPSLGGLALRVPGMFPLTNRHRATNSVSTRWMSKIWTSIRWTLLGGVRYPRGLTDRRRGVCQRACCCGRFCCGEHFGANFVARVVSEQHIGRFGFELALGD